MVKVIPLTQGKVALVDDEDFEVVSAFKWHAHRGRRLRTPDVFYVRRTINFYKEGKKQTRHQFLHQFLLGIRTGIDHEDGDGLNNQRSNLRPVNESQNAAKKERLPGSSSRFRGVTWNRQCRRWQSGIKVNNKGIYLGLFESEERAALAYDAAATIHFGAFARLNFPDRRAVPNEHRTHRRLSRVQRQPHH